MPTQFKLPNGITVILAPLPQTKAATVFVMLPVGSRYETANINGASHFIEHLMFKGTEKRPTTLDISRELDSIGAEYNAFTSKDHTAYYIKLDGKRLELAFDVLSDMLQNSVFDGEEIDKERGVIVEEINMYEDNPLFEIGSLFEEVLFDKHALGRKISGPREVIQKVSRKQLVDYRDAFYHPKNMTLVVSGNCDTKHVRKLAKEYFGPDARKGKKLAYTPVSTKQTKPRVRVTHKPSAQVQVALGFPGYKLGDPKLPALTLLSVVMGGNMSSRLFVSVREKHGLAYTVRAEASGYQDIGSFAIQAGLDTKRIEPAITLILQELAKVRDEGITEKELRDAKKFLRGKMVLHLEDSEHVAEWYARQHTLRGKLEQPAKRLQEFDKVTLRDVQKAAQDVIVAKRLNMAIIGPFKDTKRFEKLLKF